MYKVTVDCRPMRAAVSYAYLVYLLFYIMDTVFQFLPSVIAVI